MNIRLRDSGKLALRRSEEELVVKVVDARSLEPDSGLGVYDLFDRYTRFFICKF